MARDTYEPDNLIAGNEFPFYTNTRTIKQSETPLTRGTVLGKDADDKFLLSVGTATDGSEEPRVVLAEDVDASDGDVKALVYEAGAFYANSMTFGEGHTAQSVQFEPFMQNIKIEGA
ncbi:MAG TPA: head decoration protein [Campylobacterales bacterium]|nr:head decoration protein [Sulfurospirillum arcachonense]HIP50451.1 head decoration protein [Campylobacterales bacterium]